MKNGPLIHHGYSKQWYEKIGDNIDPRWLGVTVVKHPIDLFTYQEIIYETRPDLIVETGTFAGGSALFMANLFDLLAADDWKYTEDAGRILSIDVAVNRQLPNHPRIDYLLGMSSTSPEVVSHVAKAADGKRTMVILDSAHNADHVSAELDLYAPMVSKGCYLIVEDTNADGYFLGVGDIDGEGPAEAVKRFQPSNRGFEQDRARERMGFSQNPGGFLKRVR